MKWTGTLFGQVRRGNDLKMMQKYEDILAVFPHVIVVIEELVVSSGAVVIEGEDDLC